MLTARCEKVLKIVILKFNSNNVSLLVWSAWNSAAKMWIKKKKTFSLKHLWSWKKNHFGETFLHFSTNFIQLWKEKSAILALSNAALIISLLFFKFAFNVLYTCDLTVTRSPTQCWWLKSKNLPLGSETSVQMAESDSSNDWICSWFWSV